MPSSWSLVPLTLLMASSMLMRCETKKRVSTVLSAKWSETSLVLEAAEFMADQSNDNAFWALIDHIDKRSSVWKEKKDREVYEEVVDFVAKFLSRTQLQLLKLDLSLRTYSPLLQMYREVAHDRGVIDLDCSVVLETNNRLFCSLEEATSVISVKRDDVEKNNRTQIFHTDHVYLERQGTKSDLPLVVLYGAPGQLTFGSISRQLRQMADDGLIVFVFRPLDKDTLGPLQKVRLSGYGLEMQIKSTEYKAQDDSLQAQKVSDSEEEDAEEDETNSKRSEGDFAALKPSQTEKLSLQASERVMRSPESDRLKTLIDLAHNFPSRASRLSRIKVSPELRKESKLNQDHFMYNMNLQPSDAALFINGLFFDMDYVDIFTVMDTLKSEGVVLDSLSALGLTEKEASKLVTLELSGGEKKLEEYGVDIRDSSVQWVNDIEKDDLYRGWGSSLNELLRPTFPGMLRSVRRNLFNVVIVCKPGDSSTRPLLKLLESFYLHRAPLRVGIVFVVGEDGDGSDKNDDEADDGPTGFKNSNLALLEAFNYISKSESAAEALAFLTDVYSRVGSDNVPIAPKDVIDTFKINFGSKIDIEAVFGTDSEYDVGREMGVDFAERAGFKELPQVLMNGVPIDQSSLTEDDFEEALMMRLMRTTSEMQKLVYRGNIKDKENVIDFLMSRPNIMPLLNDRVLSSDKAKHLSLCCQSPLGDLTVESLTKDTDSSKLMVSMHENLRYFQSEKKKTNTRVLTLWLIVDLETTQGRRILRSGLSHLKGSSHIRLAIVNNGDKVGFATKMVKYAIDVAESSTGLINLLAKTLKEDTLQRLIGGQRKLGSLDVNGMDTKRLEKLMEEELDSEWTLHRRFVESVLGFSEGQNGILVNGKLIGPLEKEENFGVDDFNLLEKYSMSLYGEKLLSTLHELAATKDSESLLSSDKAMKIASVLLGRTTQSKSRHSISFSSDQFSVIKMEPKEKGPSFDLTAIFDPVSRAAQKIAPLLQILHHTLNARVSVFLNAVEKHEELPQKSYYQLVLASEPSFDDDGKLSHSSLVANFSELPEEPLFTMHYHIPDNWLIEPVKSVYDLDNIRLQDIDDQVVHSEFELEYLLLEGHCFETMTNSPPRGLQLTLGTDSQPVLEDTIVMANLGYLQLKTRPGRWLLNLHQGRSAELYDIVSHEGTETNRGDKGTQATDIQVLISSFKSKIIKLRVTKKPERRHEDLLEDNSDDSSASSSGGLWDSITTTLSGSSKEKEDKNKIANKEDEEDTLNIFCLASGHLYERLVKIMMLSTIRHTNARVKFWILENFLSPSLKQFLPAFSKHFGFDFQFVQYKWPRWLNQQKEKQRIIWGYKILFLDVMFPLSVKKIIFVDTDQIVRADLTELRDLDLKGAPYGYTPFCDSNEAMEGFRFWKSGYWKSHLAGKPYHISALYVVDLVRFRKLAAGDRLRGQYQALSQDPNSLSNLDQDLPNNMIHQVPIFSLPQEWLWCETWCGSETLAKAKSIDLCNNPLTKEPKLDAARRIVPEWIDYDEEVRLFARSLSEQTTTSTATRASTEGKETRSEKEEL